MPDIQDRSDLQRTAYARGEDDLLVPGLEHLGWCYFVDARPDALHAHRHAGAWELCYIVRGRVGWWAGDEHFELEPGDCYLTFPDEVHGAEHGVMDRCEIYWVSFALRPGPRGLGLSREQISAIEAAFRAAPRRVCRGPETLPGHYRGLLDAIAAGDDLAAARARGHLALLLAEAAAAYASSAPAAEARRWSPRVERAVAFMRARLAEQPGVDAIAAAAGLRASRFRELLRAETGFSPQELLTHLRIDAAKGLLDRGERSITDIALATGFNSSQYFATTFKRLTGFSPSAYRRRGKELP